MPQQIYSYSQTTPTSPLAYSTSSHGSIPIPITNQRKANVFYPSRCNHARSSGSFGFIDTPSLTTSSTPNSFRSMRHNSLHGQLVGSYEESILNGRMSTFPSKPITFIAQIGVLGRGKCKQSLKCPPHINLTFPAHFYELQDVDNPVTPYVGNVDLENGLTGERFKKFPGGYRLPLKGQLQIVIKNPNKTAVKIFLIPYDLSDMPPGTKTFIRQKSYTIPSSYNSMIQDYGVENKINNNNNDSFAKSTLRYAIHLQFCSPAKKKVYLYKYVRVVFANRVPDGSEKLNVVNSGPGEPKYVPMGSLNLKGLLGLGLVEENQQDSDNDDRQDEERQRREKKNTILKKNGVNIGKIVGSNGGSALSEKFKQISKGNDEKSLSMIIDSESENCRCIN
ncbi:hypothetical protein RclHR1_02490014 [Rhizophagus clarus]|uniref:Atos-like conserved domain-containing protein n=1 Tax=Rhizophagus clarus TaxID=94130 RepID=A0A2Z6RC53_9GLOM|nr:hypothetical protein RclHR1_02490014 [Rhizophagus clarus]GES75302.1 predicted protein [ [Rhizophagus clarus]